MNVLSHGGYCCGIRHICSLGVKPAATLDAAKTDGQQKYCNVPQAFTFDRPAETYESRLRFFVSECKSNWGAGLIEIVLAVEEGYEPGCHCCDYEPGPDQVEAWGTILADLGFKEVTKFRNSNTNNWCHVFHLVYNTFAEG